MRVRTLTVALVSVLLVVGAGTAGAFTTPISVHAQQSPTGTPGTEMNRTATATGAGGQNNPSITFDDQAISDQSVSIQSVTVPQPGFVVIYDSTRSGEEVNQIIGTFYLLGSGTFANIPVPLDTPINQSTSLTAVVHLDTNSNGQFDYVSTNGTQDPPLTPQGDQRIVDIAQVTVQNSSGSNGTPNSGNGGATNADSKTQAASGGDGGTASDSSTNETGGGSEDGQQGTEVGGPGFGFIAALGALLAAAFFVTRHD